MHDKQLYDESDSRPQSFGSFSSGDTVAFTDGSLQRTASNSSGYTANRDQKLAADSPNRTPRLAPIRDGEALRTDLLSPVAIQPPRRASFLRQSSLRIESRLSEDERLPPALPPSMLGTRYFDPLLTSNKARPYSHPSPRTDVRTQYNIRPRLADLKSEPSFGDVDPWRLPELPPSRLTTPLDSQKSPTPKPRPSFKRLSSLDNLMTFREEKAEWKRASSIMQRTTPEPLVDDRQEEEPKVFDTSNSPAPSIGDTEKSSALAEMEYPVPIAITPPSPSRHRSKFRHIMVEVGFCFTIAMTQFLAEYLITGFAIEVPRLVDRHGGAGSGSMGLFWPASLLSLILSATLLIFARLSDMYGGYANFMLGVVWLAIWTLVPGFCNSAIMLDVSRAMQGLAIAAFMPSTFAMVGSIYPEGPRRNFVMGLYSGCAPLGFFSGFLAAGALPKDKPQWYFWIASLLSFVTFVTAFLTVPSDRTDRRKLGLRMDWTGSFLIMAGLILVSYALSVEPYANQDQSGSSGFGDPIVLGPLISGLACLGIAIWYEGWYAECPLLPFDFFKSRSVRTFSIACLCFYASYGVWLYNSAQFFQSPTGITRAGEAEVTGITLAVWYTPTAIGGVVLCVIGGSLMHIVPIMVLLLLSAVAWIAAPLLLALAPLPLDYWSYVVPSMLCATIGIDLTFTISIVYLSSVQPLRYQGLSGAVCSILVNLAMSFSLSISEIVMNKAESTFLVPGSGLSPGEQVAELDRQVNHGFRATFLYAAASAGVGLIVCMTCVRISRSMMREQLADEEGPRPTSSDSTLVDEGEETHAREENAGPMEQNA